MQLWASRSKKTGTLLAACRQTETQLSDAVLVSAAALGEQQGDERIDRRTRIRVRIEPAVVSGSDTAAAALAARPNTSRQTSMR
jgi:hypothetical protein